MVNNELYHHGIKGQKWGVRRYQNPDGTLTALGQKKLYKSMGMSEKSQKKNADRIKKSISPEQLSELKRLNKKFSDAARKESDNNEYEKALNKASIKAYDDTIKYFQKNDPKRFKEMTSDAKQKGITDLTGYHDFRKTFESFESNAHSKVKKPGPSESDKIWEQEYNPYVKKVTKDIVGNYGDRKISKINNDYYTSSYAEFVEYTLRHI